jgi:hypothetical protein
MIYKYNNSDDVIDSRDILDYIEKYEDNEDYKKEVEALQKVIDEYCNEYDEGLKDLEFGVFFIRDSYFEDYMWDYFLQFNDIDEALECYIDIEAFARDQQKEKRMEEWKQQEFDFNEWQEEDFESFEDLTDIIVNGKINIANDWLEFKN